MLNQQSKMGIPSWYNGFEVEWLLVKRVPTGLMDINGVPGIFVLLTVCHSLTWMTSFGWENTMQLLSTFACRAQGMLSAGRAENGWKDAMLMKRSSLLHLVSQAFEWMVRKNVIYRAQRQKSVQEGEKRPAAPSRVTPELVLAISRPVPSLLSIPVFCFSRIFQ